MHEVAWFKENSGEQTHEVGIKKGNELDIFDMSGNVWEWCWDWFGTYPSGLQSNPSGAEKGTFRVIRGGSWFNKGHNHCISDRFEGSPLIKFPHLGLRIARSML